MHDRVIGRDPIVGLNVGLPDSCDVNATGEEHVDGAPNQGRVGLTRVPLVRLRFIKARLSVEVLGLKVGVVIGRASSQ